MSNKQIPRETADLYQDFYDFMAQEHNLTLTISEMNDIVLHAQELVKKVDKDVNSEELSEAETTDVQEIIKVEIYKDLLVELYNFAYKQAVKTNTVEKLHDIDRRINEELVKNGDEKPPLKCGNPNPPCMPNLKFGFLECCNCEWGE